MRYSFALVILFAATGPMALATRPQVAAATMPRAPVPTTVGLADIIHLGLKRSPKIKKSAADLAAAQAETRQVKGQLYPEVNLHATATGREDSVNSSSLSSGSSTVNSESYQGYLEAIQPLYTGGAVSGAMALRKREEEIQQLTLIKDHQDFVVELASAFYKVAEQTQLLQAAQENIETLENYSKVIQRYEKIGRARKTDQLQALINLTTARADTSELEAQLFSEKEILRELLALESLPEITFQHDGPPIKPAQLEKKPSSSFQIALAQNPEIQIAELQKEKISNEKSVALAEDLPSLSLKGQLGYRSSDQTNWLESDSSFSSLTLDLKVPLFSGLSSMAKRRYYEEKRVSSTRELEIKKFSIESSLNTKLKGLDSSFERLTIAQQATRDARQALQLANRDYQRNLISSLEVINIQRTKYEAERLLIRTQYTYLRTLLDARKLMGLNLEKIYGEKE